MDYKRLYGIYYDEEAGGYISGTYKQNGKSHVHLTDLYPSQFPEDEIPIPVLQIASIKTYDSLVKVQKDLEKYASYVNVADASKLEARELNYQEIELIDRCRAFMEGRKRARSYAEQFKKEKLKCSNCGNTDIEEMVVGEKTFQLMDRQRTTQVDERFQKEISVYCNKCTAKIL
ncbi:MAG: hypothetical protein ACLTXM_12690 [Enterococcus sp.]